MSYGGNFEAGDGSNLGNGLWHADGLRHCRGRFLVQAREKELQAHQEMRIREMEHQRRMKELELEIEKTKASQSQPRAS